MSIVIRSVSVRVLRLVVGTRTRGGSICGEGRGRLSRRARGGLRGYRERPIMFQLCHVGGGPKRDESSVTVQKFRRATRVIRSGKRDCLRLGMGSVSTRSEIDNRAVMNGLGALGCRRSRILRAISVMGGVMEVPVRTYGVRG